MYVQHLGIISGGDRTLHQHPWRWVGKPLSFDEEQSCTTLLTEFIQTLRKQRHELVSLADTTDVRLEPSPAGLERSRRLFSALPQAGSGVIGTLTATLS